MVDNCALRSIQRPCVCVCVSVSVCKVCRSQLCSNLSRPGDNMPFFDSSGQFQRPALPLVPGRLRHLISSKLILIELKFCAHLVPVWNRRRSGRPWSCSSSARCGIGTGTAGCPVRFNWIKVKWIKVNWITQFFFLFINSLTRCQVIFRSQVPPGGLGSDSSPPGGTYSDLT